ncbi:response regulator [Stigmatella erecta]|uniref:Response regulator receiver domain-containing protein n=1 Tax=Stigmatella erecta TaxID=83460 RepID=A0A1I0FP93_9BACT|nr:response regulator [Stigmatella erecta]SET59965.1 Response regulator receiver domain-containing protein [Stigmatella erecta]
MGARSSRAAIIEPTSRPAAAGLSPRTRKGKSLRVMLVEPDAPFQAQLGTALSEAGFEVTVVSTAEAALEELAALPAPPHLVVAEAMLEGLDGFLFCEKLRSEVRTALVPVLLLCSKREPFHPELAATVGADDYLPKPMRVQDVVALARLKAGRRASEMAYEAHAARLPLTQIARALLAGARSGRVVLKDNEGFFAFRGGYVVDAAFQGERGVAAFRRLLGFGSGVYAVSFGPELHRGSLLMDLPYLSEQVLPALERFEKLREVGVPLAARLTVDFARLSEHLASLPDDIISLVRLFDGRRVVRAVLLECRFAEVIAYEAITQLFSLGVLMPASHVEERERPPAAPSLFLTAADALDMMLSGDDGGDELPIFVDEAAAAATGEEAEETIDGEPLDEEEAAEEAAPRSAPLILNFPKRPRAPAAEALQAGLLPLEQASPRVSDKV